MNKYKENQASKLERLNQYVPVVDKVHGGHHPEFHTVRKLYEEIYDKIEHSDASTLDLKNEFESLREVTENYKVPSDTCETFEAVYVMLSELDRDYQKRLENK